MVCLRIFEPFYGFSSCCTPQSMCRIWVPMQKGLQLQKQPHRWTALHIPFFFCGGGGCVWGQQDRQNIINNKVQFGKRSWHKPKIICWKLGQYYISKFQSKEANWTFLNCFSNIIYYDIKFETSADNLRC